MKSAAPAGRAYRSILACALSLLISGFAGLAAAQTTDFESAMQAFERQDAKYPPPADAIVVTGSSTIRLWSGIRNDLAPLEVIPRGFGSSTADDLDFYLDRVVLPYAPRAVAIYEGDHDLQVGMTPEFILERLTSVVQRIGTALPESRIYLISVKPSPKYFSLWPQAVGLNQMIAGLCQQAPRCTFIDTASSLLLPNGKVDRSLFRSDRVHLNAAGYAVWSGILEPVLMAGEGGDIVLPDFHYQDVGSVAAAGTATTNGGFVTLDGSGAGVAGTSDGFQFAWRQLIGNGQVTARVASIADASGNPFAGVMVREQLSPDARYALASVAPASGAGLSYRTNVGGVPREGAFPDPGATAPYWVKLVRKSGTVICYLSANGISWKDCGRVTLSALKKTVYVGLAVSSASDGDVASGTFDNVWIHGSTSLPAPTPAGDVTAPSEPEFVAAEGQGTDRIEVSWAPSSDTGTGVAGYRVYRDGSPVAIATTTATHFLDVGLAAEATHNYTVAAFDDALPANVSALSAPASATTSAATLP